MKKKEKRLLSGAQQAVGGESKRTFDVATAIAFKHFERIVTNYLLLALLGAFTAQIRGWYHRNEHCFLIAPLLLNVVLFNEKEITN